MPKITLPHIDNLIRSYGLEIDVTKTRMGLFKQAMTHASLGDFNYDRLEYLGDSVYHLILSEYLYDRYDDQDEGFLTRLRIRIERGDSMIELAKIIKLDRFIQISRSTDLEEEFLEDIFEAFVAAFYLNYGIDHTRRLLVTLFERHKDFAELIHFDDNYKDQLLRYFHQMNWGEPEYVKEDDCIIVCDDEGKVLGSQLLEQNRRQAEQLASKKALIVLKQLDNDVVSEKKIKNDKGPVDLYNSCNKLLRITDVKEIFGKYGVKPPRRVTKDDLKLYTEAMTHKSYLVRKVLTDHDKSVAKQSVPLQKKSNNRLLFLGGAVYHFVIAEHLFHQYQNEDEGFLTRLRSHIEAKKVKFCLSTQSQIKQFILISHGIESTHGRVNLKMIGKGFEAFMGASYLLYGFAVVQRYLLEIVRQEVNIESLIRAGINYKDQIAKIYREKGWGYPKYQLIDDKGPGHRKLFTMGVYRGRDLMARGRSGTKKRASQLAAKRLFKKLSE